MATGIAWTTQNGLLRHGGVVLLLVLVVSTLAWSVAFNKDKTMRIVFWTGWMVCFWLSTSAVFSSTAPFASALGLEAGTKRVARHYYIDDDALSAFAWIERNSSSDDKVLIFTSFLSYPLERSAFFDLQWENPTLLRWSDEEGNADKLARRLKREGVRYVIYYRLASDFLAGGNKRFAERMMPETEWNKFWGRWMEPTLRLENTQVFRLRESAALVSNQPVDLPGIQEKPLSLARRSKNAGNLQESLEVLTSFLREHPEAAYVHFVRAGLFMAQGRRAEAIGDLREAEAGGLKTQELYNLWEMALPEGTEKERVSQKGEEVRLYQEAFKTAPEDS